MAQYVVPSPVRPKSKTLTVLGCNSWAAACTSRSNRAVAARFPGLTSLIAHGRLSSLCSAK